MLPSSPRVVAGRGTSRGLDRLVDGRADVADVAAARVTVGIVLIGVADRRAVVTGVADRVAVGIGLPRVGDQVAIVRGIRRAVAVQIVCRARESGDGDARGLHRRGGAVAELAGVVPAPAQDSASGGEGAGVESTCGSTPRRGFVRSGFRPRCAGGEPGPRSPVTARGPGPRLADQDRANFRRSRASRGSGTHQLSHAGRSGEGPDRAKRSTPGSGSPHPVHEKVAERVGPAKPRPHAPLWHGLDASIRRRHLVVGPQSSTVARQRDAGADIATVRRPSAEHGREPAPVGLTCQLGREG